MSKLKLCNMVLHAGQVHLLVCDKSVRIRGKVITVLLSSLRYQVYCIQSTVLWLANTVQLFQLSSAMTANTDSYFNYRLRQLQIQSYFNYHQQQLQIQTVISIIVCDNCKYRQLF